MDRIVVYVIHGCPEVAFRSNRPLEAVMPDLSPSLLLLPIPGEGRASVKLPQLLTEYLDVLRFEKYVVMIWQDAPGIDLRPGLAAGV